MKKLILHHLWLYCFNLSNAAWKWQEDFLFGRYTKGVPYVNGRCTKAESFLPKMVYKRVRDRTSGWGLPILYYIFFCTYSIIYWGQYVYQTTFSYSLQWTPLLEVNFNWETLAKLENSKGWRKQFCANALLSCEDKYRKWEQIASSQFPARVLPPP